MSDSGTKSVSTTNIGLWSSVASPWAIVGLLLLCMVVGIILDAMGLTPEGFYVWIYTSVLSLVHFVWNAGLGIVWPIARFVLIGASVVLPIWAVIVAIRYVRVRRAQRLLDRST